jgi:hypothetical protein
MLTVPVRLPAVVGANCALNIAVPPAAIVAGIVRPLTLYPVPVAESFEIVRADVPVFVIVMD